MRTSWEGVKQTHANIGGGSSRHIRTSAEGGQTDTANIGGGGQAKVDIQILFKI